MAQTSCCCCCCCSHRTHLHSLHTDTNSNWLLRRASTTATTSIATVRLPYVCTAAVGANVVAKLTRGHCAVALRTSLASKVSLALLVSCTVVKCTHIGYNSVWATYSLTDCGGATIIKQPKKRIEYARCVEIQRVLPKPLAHAHQRHPHKNHMHLLPPSTIEASRLETPIQAKTHCCCCCCCSRNFSHLAPHTHTHTLTSADMLAIEQQQLDFVLCTNVNNNHVARANSPRARPSCAILCTIYRNRLTSKSSSKISRDDRLTSCD